MSLDLIIRTANGDFDLFEGEEIVQTIQLFSLKDISVRPGEYTNEFKMPLTNNNIAIIRNANFTTSINTLPYQKVNCEIITSGLSLKTGLIEITSISDVISARFYSGNSVFFDLVKSSYLNDLDWSEYDHIWNLTNAIAASSSLYGYLYPLINYNGQNTLTDILDIRKVLPATYIKTCIDKIAEKFNYSIINDFDTSDLDVALIPYSIKNPQVSAPVLLLNSVDVRLTNNIFPTVSSTSNPYSSVMYNSLLPNISRVFRDNLVIKIVGSGYTVNQNLVTVPIDFNLINTTGSSVNYSFLNREFTSQYSGNYDYSFDCEMVDYDYMNFNFNHNISNFVINTATEFSVLKISGGTTTLVQNIKSNTGYLATTGSGSYSSIPPITQTLITTNINGSVYLNVGDKLKVVVNATFNCLCTLLTDNTVVTGSFNPEVKDTSSFIVNLQPQLIFGGLITYASMLPKIKCSDFLKDICIRFGLIIGINEDLKEITFSKIDKVTENIPLRYDWSDKIDDSIDPVTVFKSDNYAQINNFKHTDDKLNLTIDNGSSYKLVVNNTNLIVEKDFYISPFSASQNVDFNGEVTTYINLYDVNTGNFDNDVVPRIAFSEPTSSQFKFTDGATTSSYIDAVRVWFIDNDLPNLSMGFGTNLIEKNSKTLINALQNLRIERFYFNINIIDIKSIDFLKPVFVRQKQAYYIISSINQFNYTVPGLTEVELIKLN